MTAASLPDLSRRGSYPAIAAGLYPELPVRLFEHIGDVYRRVEIAAGDDRPHFDALASRHRVRHDDHRRKMDADLQAMLRELQIWRGALAVVTAVGSFLVWRRMRFWLPPYVHGLACLGLLIGVGIVATLSPDAPLQRWGAAGHLFALLVCPALVYGFFFAFGGPLVARRRRRARPRT